MITRRFAFVLSTVEKIGSRLFVDVVPEPLYEAFAVDWRFPVDSGNDGPDFPVVAANSSGLLAVDAFSDHARRLLRHGEALENFLATL